MFDKDGRILYLNASGRDSLAEAGLDPAGEKDDLLPELAGMGGRLAPIRGRLPRTWRGDLSASARGSDDAGRAGKGRHRPIARGPQLAARRNGEDPRHLPHDALASPARLRPPSRRTHQVGSGFVALLALLVGQQASDTTTYADRATRDLVARAVARHSSADTTVRDYQAHLRYRVSFGIGQRRWANVPTAAVEEQDGTVHWSRCRTTCAWTSWDAARRRDSTASTCRRPLIGPGSCRAPSATRSGSLAVTPPRGRRRIRSRAGPRRSIATPRATRWSSGCRVGASPSVDHDHSTRERRDRGRRALGQCRERRRGALLVPVRGPRALDRPRRRDVGRFGRGTPCRTPREQILQIDAPTSSTRCRRTSTGCPRARSSPAA